MALISKDDPAEKDEAEGEKKMMKVVMAESCLLSAKQHMAYLH